MSQTESAPPILPKTLGGVVAYLQLSDADAASKLYQKALGAEEMFRMPPAPNGKLMHVHLYLNGSSLMMSDAFPEQGHGLETPAGFTLTLNVDDIDAWYRRAVENGFEGRMEPQTMFWGDRYAELRDPFGVSWAMNQSRSA